MIIIMNVLKCPTLAELHEYTCTISAGWLDIEHSFSCHQISSELVNFLDKAWQRAEETLLTKKKIKPKKQRFKDTRVSVLMFYADVNKSKEISKWWQIDKARIKTKYPLRLQGKDTRTDIVINLRLHLGW